MVLPLSSPSPSTHPAQSYHQLPLDELPAHIFSDMPTLQAPGRPAAETPGTRHQYAMVPPEGVFGWILVNLRSGFSGAAPVVGDGEGERKG
jgi:hypothetical protein